jgi:hypothetical protein
MTNSVLDLVSIILFPHTFALFVGLFSVLYAPFTINSAKNPARFLSMFTRVSPNQLKIIEWGGTFVRVICVNPGYAFRAWVDSGGNMLPSKNNLHEWEVVERPPTCPPMPEVVPGSIFSGRYTKWLSPLFVFRLVSYKITGLHFYGIAPYVQVRSQDYKRGKVPDSGEISLETVTQVVDETDHFRLSAFTNLTVSGKLPTQQGWGVSVLVALELSITDAPSAAYSVNRWDQNIQQRVVAAIAEAMHGANIGSVYGGGDISHKNAIVDKCWFFLTGLDTNARATNARYFRTVADLGSINVHNIRVVDMNADQHSQEAVEQALSAAFVGTQEGNKIKNKLTLEGEGRQAFLSNQISGVSESLTDQEKMRLAIRIIEGEALRNAVIDGGAKVIATFGNQQQEPGAPLSLPQFIAATKEDSQQNTEGDRQ